MLFMIADELLDGHSAWEPGNYLKIITRLKTQLMHAKSVVFCAHVAFCSFVEYKTTNS